VTGDDSFWVCLGRIQKSESRIQERAGRLWRAFYLMVIGWARFVTPPVFGSALSPLKVGVNYGCTPLACVLSYATHYTTFGAEKQVLIGRNEDLVRGGGSGWAGRDGQDVAVE